MITLHQRTIPSDAIRQLYESAFPLAERRPWPAQLKLLDAGKLRLLEIQRDKKYAGFIFYWSLPDFAFVEHFAIEPAARGGGAGTAVMEQMAAALKAIVLEVEPPDTEQAIRRINFYERLGYQTFLDYYEQPPYHPGYPPLQLRLMHLHLPPALGFVQIKQELYREIYQQ
ncbi:Acetyltransferase (GNAT) family protein [Chitinophaga jiangningensis]|uniref:Acetyltransferase (GNAT) family protein n=1 Tax=Chitinophaga jiangningensis TaxID=1419482 RepID=A0A1M6WD86_9BACT|nr:GNAT family N-acetyltransferase [Chitinophaga jiangningensis]SHK91536.1 Acetyltransferase (GNAT) family protein [Chitinophaga jiangningensis]